LLAPKVIEKLLFAKLMDISVASIHPEAVFNQSTVGIRDESPAITRRYNIQLRSVYLL